MFGLLSAPETPDALLDLVPIPALLRRVHVLTPRLRHRALLVGDADEELPAVQGRLGVELLHELAEFRSRNANLDARRCHVRQKLDHRGDDVDRGVADSGCDAASRRLRADVLDIGDEVEVAAPARGVERVEGELGPGLVLDRPIQTHEGAEEVRADPLEDPHVASLRPTAQSRQSLRRRGRSARKRDGNASPSLLMAK